MTVIDEVAAERRSQIDKGWTPDHDDYHDNGELSDAAACYASTSPIIKRWHNELWPWDSGFWKPKDRRRNLIRAAALIVAEIERLDRATG